MVQKTVRTQAKNVSRANPRNHNGNNIENAILLALPRKDRERMMAKLEAVDLPVHTVLHEMERPIQFAYFLNEGLASILTVLPGGKTVEVGLTGKDGFVGVPLLAGLSSSPTRIVMQVAGGGFRMGARDMKKALRGSAALEKGMLHHAQNQNKQATQVAACNRLHEVSKRLARWLLMSQDRLGGNIVPLAQQYLAHMLGTRRASVTVAARTLQKAGVISYNRGVVTIKSRRKLESASCPCYQMITRQSLQWQNESKG